MTVTSIRGVWSLRTVVEMSSLSPISPDHCQIDRHEPHPAVVVQGGRRPVVWMADIRAAGLGKKARLEAGGLIDDLQEGVSLRLPHSRPMPAIGERCHELRVREPGHNWRILYHVGYGEIVILGVFDKKRRKTPRNEIHRAKRRLRRYTIVTGGGSKC